MSFMTNVSDSQRLPKYFQEKETPLKKFLRPIEITEKESHLANIDCIYVINLDFRTEKWHRMEKLCRENTIRVNRVSAVNGYALTEEEKKELCGPYPLAMTGPQVGCILSHMSVLWDAWKRGFDTIWVMEDDVEFLDDLQRIPKLVQSLKEVDPEWDLLFTDAGWRERDGSHGSVSRLHQPRPDQPVSRKELFQEPVEVTPDLRRHGSRWGMHSVLYSKKGLHKVLDYFTHVYLYLPLDWDIHYIPNIHEYSTAEDIVSNQLSLFVSDITLDHVTPILAIFSDKKREEFPFENENRPYKNYAFRFFSFEQLQAGLPVSSSMFKNIMVIDPLKDTFLLKKLPRKKTCLFITKPERHSQQFYEGWERIYTWDDRLVDNKTFFKGYFPYRHQMVHPLPQFEIKKHLAMILKKETEAHCEVFKFYAKRPKGELECYGNLPREKSFQKMYRGTFILREDLKGAIKTLLNYRFCICFEEELDLPGYISEDIFSCFAAGCVPVYRGATRIETFIPKGCFIEYRDFSGPEELETYLTQMTEEEYAKYLVQIRKFLVGSQSWIFSQERFLEIAQQLIAGSDHD